MRTVADNLLLGICFFVAGSTSHASAQQNQLQRFALGADAIIRALHEDGLNVHPEDVGMPMVLSTTVSNPALEVVGADRLPNGHLRLRMRCKHPGECVPFSVTLLRGVVAPVLLASAQTPVLPIGTDGPVAAVPPKALAEAASNAESPVMVRPGTKLTMLLEDGHVHIHLPVISLGSAAANQEVRVATSDHKKTYRAMVVNATTVQGIME